MLVLCHASYCVHYIAESLWCVVFSLAIDVTVGFSAWGPEGPLGAVGLVALLLLGVYAHFFPSLLVFLLRLTKHQELHFEKQLFLLEISIAFLTKFTWNSSQRRTSRKKRTGNALSGCRSHTFSGNLNNPPHRFFLSLTLFLSSSP